MSFNSIQTRTQGILFLEGEDKTNWGCLMLPFSFSLGRKSYMENLGTKQIKTEIL